MTDHDPLLPLEPARKCADMMDLASADTLLSILLGNSRRIIAAHYGVDRAEPTFFQIVALLREFPQLRERFVVQVEETLGERTPTGLGENQVPSDLVELAAHELRWPEFGRLAHRRIDQFFHGDTVLAMGDLSVHIFEALRDDWEDRMFYSRYPEGLGSRSD